MQRGDIKSGRTYVGHDGKRKRVDHIIETLKPTLLAITDLQTGHRLVGVTLDQFARWARKEEKK